jgi:hypothetical protein
MPKTFEWDGEMVPAIQFHYAHSLRTDCLTVMFLEHLISYFGGNAWSSGSPDLMTPNSFLWGYLKSEVYVNNTLTTTETKDHITSKIKN